MTEQELFEEVAQLVDYDPETGSMVWRRREGASKQWNTRFAGRECGTTSVYGYRVLGYKSTSGKAHYIRVHRLAWFICHGMPPKHEIDHFNRDKLDNCINNLRDVSHAVNMRNSSLRSNNTSGTTGVHWKSGRGKWEAKVKLNCKHHYLGLFDDISEAEAAVKAFRAKHCFTETHGEAA